MRPSHKMDEMNVPVISSYRSNIIPTFYETKSQDSSVGVVTGYGLDDRIVL